MIPNVAPATSMSEFLTTMSTFTVSPALAVTVGITHAASPSTGAIVVVVVVTFWSVTVVVVVPGTSDTLITPLIVVTSYVNSELSLNTSALSPKPIL